MSDESYSPPTSLKTLVDVGFDVDLLRASIELLVNKAPNRHTIRRLTKTSANTATAEDQAESELFKDILKTSQIKLASRIKTNYEDDPENIFRQILNFHYKENDFDQVLNRYTHKIINNSSLLKPSLLDLEHQDQYLSIFYHPLIAQKITSKLSNIDKSSLGYLKFQEEQNRKFFSIGYSAVHFLGFSLLNEVYGTLSNEEIIEYQSKVCSNKSFAKMFTDYGLDLQLSQLLSCLRLNTYDKFNELVKSSIHEQPDKNTASSHTEFNAEERIQLHGEIFLSYIGAYLNERFSNIVLLKQWLLTLFEPHFRALVNLEPMFSAKEFFSASGDELEHDDTLSKRIDFYTKALKSKNLNIIFRLKKAERPFKMECLIGDEFVAADYGNTTGEAERNCLAAVFSNHRITEGLITQHDLARFPPDVQKTSAGGYGGSGGHEKRRKLANNLFESSDSSSERSLDESGSMFSAKQTLTDTGLDPKSAYPSSTMATSIPTSLSSPSMPTYHKDIISTIDVPPDTRTIVGNTNVGSAMSSSDAYVSSHNSLLAPRTAGQLNIWDNEPGANIESTSTQRRVPMNSYLKHTANIQANTSNPSNPNFCSSANANANLFFDQYGVRLKANMPNSYPQYPQHPQHSLATPQPQPQVGTPGAPGASAYLNASTEPTPAAESSHLGSQIGPDGIDYGAKNRLYALAGQRRFVPDYKYGTLGDGYTHAQVYLNSVLLGEGIDSNKKKASQRAAMQALRNERSLKSLGINSAL